MFIRHSDSIIPMKYKISYFLCSISFLLCLHACSTGSAENKVEGDKEAAPKVYTRFNNSYARTFNDLPDLHNEAAGRIGVKPLVARADTAKYADKLQRIPLELEIYKVDKLTHSIPFLVPEAVQLLTDIGLNFRDSLISKGIDPLYKPIITSVTRTDEDVKRLSRRNVNASEGSVHRCGTTIDISWSRFEKLDQTDERIISDGKLKQILGQVLHDLRERDRCYVKHERKQACFHITAR